MGILLLAVLFGVASAQKIDSVRLVGPTADQGRVEVSINGEWGTVCDDQFDADDARVVCNMLGSKGDIAVATVEGVFGPGTGRIFYDELDCVGNEASLADCRSSSFKDCFHSEDAGVICNKDDIGFRLVGGNDTNSGRVEVQINGEWGTVCDDEFTSTTAKIICKQMGLPSANAYPYAFGPGQRNQSIFLDDLLCRGTETNVLQCNMTEIGNNDCDHSEDVGVVCTDAAPNLQVRLVGGASNTEGRVEVNIGGNWGTICDDSWDAEDAKVVCNMLGLTGGIPRGVGNAFFGAGSGGILMDEVECKGTESSLASCTFGGFGNHDCDHSEDAGVMCHSENSPALQVRLVNGATPKEGRVEVFYNNQWGTVCDDEFDDREARVVCGMLGFNGTASGVGNAYFGQGSGRILMDELACTGNEDNLASCTFDGFGNNDCDHDEDAGVICDAGHQNLTVRLVDGKVPNEGRLEVLYHGHWGTVCDDLWTNTNAKVVCRMLGYPTGNAEGIHGAYFGRGSGTIWLDNVHCSGGENSIANCRHNVYGSNNCDHGEDAGVRCGSTTESPVRLVGGTTPYEGRLEIFHEGRWGTVCDDGFNNNAAMVLCRSIGYPSSNPTLLNNTFGTPPSEIWLDDVYCMGNETSLDLCQHNRFGTNNCRHNKDVALRCRDHGIKCYHCDGLEDPKTCQETIQCSAGEVCEEAAYIASGTTRFSMTCQSKFVCDALTAEGNVVGKRDIERRQAQTVQVKCCSSPLCNRDLIDKASANVVPGGAHGGNPSTCEDDPKANCPQLAATNICSNPQAAKVFCPKFCGICS